MPGDYSAQSVTQNAYAAANQAEQIRNDIMGEIKAALGSSNQSSNDISAVNVNLGGINVDISSGPGALVLDDTLQKLSTIQQTSAQLLAAKNRGQREISQIMR